MRDRTLVGRHARLGPVGHAHPAHAGAPHAAQRPTRPWRPSSRRSARPDGSSRMTHSLPSPITGAVPSPTSAPGRPVHRAREGHASPTAAAPAPGAGAGRDLAADRRGRFRRAGRPVGLRQVDHPQAGRPACSTRRAATSSSPAARSAPSRCGSAWRSRTRPCCRGSRIRDNVMLPLKIVPPFRQEYRRQAQGRVPRPRRGAARAGRARRLRRQISLAALRRHDAARLAVPRADPRSAAAAARRAVRRARPVHPRGAVGDHADLWIDAPADRAAGHPRPARRPPISPTASA